MIPNRPEPPNLPRPLPVWYPRPAPRVRAQITMPGVAPLDSALNLEIVVMGRAGFEPAALGLRGVRPRAYPAPRAAHRNTQPPAGLRARGLRRADLLKVREVERP
jgi:hypothetical protein